MHRSLVHGIVWIAILAGLNIAHAATVSFSNYTNTFATGGSTVYYFATASASGDICYPQPPVINLGNNTQALIPQSGSPITSSLLLFNVTSSITPATLLQNPSISLTGDEVSLRAEITHPVPTSGSGIYLPLFPNGPNAGGSNTIAYNTPSTGTSGGSEMQFGVTNAQLSPYSMSAGIPLRDVISTDFGSSGTPTNGPTNGLCSILLNLIGGGPSGSYPSMPSGTFGTSDLFCAPPGGAQVLTYTINIGFVKADNTFEGAPSNSDFETLQFVLADCPPGAASSSGNFTQFTPNMSAAPGDQQAYITNNTATPNPTDNVPIVGVNLVAGPQNPSGISPGTPNQDYQGNTNFGQTSFGGLTNDVQYCFSLGFVNAAGWPSMNESWSMYPSTSACATPSQIDGFLNRSTCFIASAAYGEEWDPRLEVLRQFRDQILERFSAGQAFVEWYYSWSPHAAHWLLSNPGYKTIVRIALLPLVEGARISLWIRANMWIFGIVLLLGTVAAIGFGVRRRSTT